MGARDLLRELDRRLLPPLAGGLDRLARSGLGSRLRRPRPLPVAALASATGVVAAAVWTAAHQPPPDRAMADVARVGVVGEQSIPGYVASSRSELAQLVAGGAAGQPYALVTFKAYLPPDRLAPTLAGVEVAQVHSRVPLAGGQTEIERIPVSRVPADVVAGMSAVADRRDRQAATYRSLSAKLTGGGAEERRLRGVYSSGARLAAAEAAAYRSRCFCVYAAVVRAAPQVLERVAGRPEVLAVDPAPEVHRLDQAVFLPPLPEQAGTVRPRTGRPAQTSPHPVTSPHAVTSPGFARQESQASPTITPATTPATSPTAGGTPSPAASQFPSSAPSATPSPSTETDR